MNKFVVVGYGILVLKEAYKPLAAIGCALALCGGAYYSWDRSQLKKRKPAEKSADGERETLINKDPNPEAIGLPSAKIGATAKRS